MKEWVLRRNNNKLARKNGHMRIPEQEWQGKNIFVWEVRPVDLNFFGTFYFCFCFLFSLTWFDRGDSSGMDKSSSATCLLYSDVVKGEPSLT